MTIEKHSLFTEVQLEDGTIARVNRQSLEAHIANGKNILTATAFALVTSRPERTIQHCGENLPHRNKKRRPHQ